MRTVGELMSLAGRKCLVTGGAGHIGLAVSETLVELGAIVGILDSNEQGCREQVEVLSQIKSDSAFAFPCDLSKEKQTRTVVRDVVNQLGGLDILVHCAAFVGTTVHSGWADNFEEQTVEAWDSALRVNLTSAFVVVQEAKAALQASGNGSVILMGSIYGSVGPDMRLYEQTSMKNPVGYGVSKGGLLQLAKYLATLLAPSVRVNTVSPGGVWRNQPEVFCERYINNTPLKRMASEEDLKGAVAYFASDLSSYVSGHNLIVDGGWTAW